ncbi:MAG: transglutaminase domain-containing protein [Clostridiales bacterium]|nr:transglutaminase domain-containing protein [Clostridiales bacterium]
MDYEGFWRAELPLGLFMGLTTVSLYIYRRNSKVYQIVLNFPEMGSLCFSPIWQRNTVDALIFHVRHAQGDIQFRLLPSVDEGTAPLQVEYDRIKACVCCTKISAPPPLDPDKVLLESVWRYEILRRYAVYAVPARLPYSIEWSYEIKSNPLSEKLISAYDLYHLSTGNDFNTMRLCLSWVNEHLRHDGTQTFLGIREANSILSTHTGKASCRGLAIVLCELLLALGIKSRFIACLPEEVPYDECHVVCVAYSDDLKKWILLDPTNNLYILDSGGTPLSLMEFRNALLCNDDFYLNQDTNWNGRRIGKTQYCDYMIKNLVRFDAVEAYYPGCDQYSTKRITLIPTNYTTTVPDRMITDDIRSFWPEENIQ